MFADIGVLFPYGLANTKFMKYCAESQIETNVLANIQKVVDLLTQFTGKSDNGVRAYLK